MNSLAVQNDDMCGVLIMDQTGAVGLDLSFASWVFLLEPIEDISVHQQVVSRAHRMGAKQPVHLETLVMKVCFYLTGFPPIVTNLLCKQVTRTE